MIVSKPSLWLAILLLLLSSISIAQTSKAPHKSHSAAKATGPEIFALPGAQDPKAMPLDAQIAAALKEISPARIRATIEKLVSFNNRNTLSSNSPELKQQGRGILAAREWIRSEYERYSKACGGCLEVKEDVFTEQPQSRIPTPTEIGNVYAIQRGTNEQNAGRIVLVTGHHDSRNTDVLNITDAAPGANDDGSGTAVSLECARVLSQHKFPATIIYLTVAGEEQGLNGSRHFAKMAKTANWDIEAALNNDIVGGDKSPGQHPEIVRVFSEGIPVAADPAQIKLIRAIGAENDAPSRELARYVRLVGNTYDRGTFHPMLVFRPDRYLRGGDHLSFSQQGYTAIRFTEYRENFNHQHQTLRSENGIEYGDLPKFVDFDFVANVARLNAATLASLASAPAPPANVKMLTKKLENDSELQWEAAPGGLASSYEVVWRETTAPDWQFAKDVGNVTQVTLPLSKDNVVFGIRSVDSKGHRSLAVTPVPER